MSKILPEHIIDGSQFPEISKIASDIGAEALPTVIQKVGDVIDNMNFKNASFTSKENMFVSLMLAVNEFMLLTSIMEPMVGDLKLCKERGDNPKIVTDKYRFLIDSFHQNCIDLTERVAEEVMGK